MDAGGVADADVEGHGDGPHVVKRARVWPHVVGNFASCVWLPVRGAPLAGAIDVAVRQAEQQLGVVFERIPLEQLHISVTRSFPVVKAMVPRFTRLMCAVARDAEMEPLRVVLSSAPCVLANDTGVTSFLALAVEPGDALDALGDITAALDDALATMGLPVFYQPARFHVSIAWTAGNHAAAALPPVSDTPLLTRCDTIDVVVGDAVHTYELQ